MEKSPTYYTELITKYLSGEITREENMILDQWMGSSAENRKLFEDLRKTWVLVEQEKLDSGLALDTEWDDFKERIREVRSSKFEVRSWQSDDNMGEYSGGRKDQGNNSKTPSIQWVLRIAAVFLLIAVPTFFLYRYFSNPELKMITADNQVVDTSLPDGTTVSLNKGTTLEFTENFKGKKREVKLSGEAYFSVKHDARRKFVIVIGDVRIEDIGTSFYVNTNKSDGQMEVVLTEGQASVYFNDQPEEQVIINPGERVDVTIAGNTILKTINEDENYMAWKTRKFVFANCTLPEVIALLNKVYQSDIRLSGKNLNNCRLSATFDNQSLESVLHVIQSTLDVSIISKGLYIEISGNMCD